MGTVLFIGLLLQTVPEPLNAAMAHVLDLHTLQLTPNKPEYLKRDRTSMYYCVNGTVSEAAEFHLRELHSRNWKTVRTVNPGRHILEKQGCYLSLTASPLEGAIKHKMNRDVEVRIRCLNSLDIRTVPEPSEAQVLTSEPWEISLKVKGRKLDTIHKRFDELLKSSQWVPQGRTDNQYYKKGFHLLIVSFHATDKDDEWRVDYSMHLQYVNLTALSSALSTRFEDNTSLHSTHRGNQASLQEEYVRAYTALGWTKAAEQKDAKVIMMELSTGDRLELTFATVEPRAWEISIVESQLTKQGWTTQSKQQTGHNMELRLTNDQKDTMTLRLEYSTPTVEARITYRPASVK